MADNKIDYFSGVRDHFNSLETQVIEVPEWGLVGDMAIHTKPFNMLEKQKIFKGASNTDLLVFQRNSNETNITIMEVAS